MYCERSTTCGSSAQEMGPKPSQLAASFGLVLRCADPVGGAAVLAQTAHTLSRALPPGGGPLYPAAIQLPFQDYKEVRADQQSQESRWGFFVTFPTISDAVAPDHILTSPAPSTAQYRET